MSKNLKKASSQLNQTRHDFWIEKIHREDKGKLWYVVSYQLNIFRSMTKGMNLGFLTKIPVRDCHEWLPQNDIVETAYGQLIINK